jgi:hypothetical protein
VSGGQGADVPPVEQQIRAAMELGLFADLPGKGKPIEGIDAHHHDEDWWLKAKLRRERLSYLPPTLAIRKEREEALEAIAAAAGEDTVRRIVADINARIRAINRMGGAGPPSTVVPLDEEAVVARWRSRGSAPERR